MKQIKMTVLMFVTLLAVSRVMTVTTGVCHAPGCDDDMSCDVSVTQEDVTTIRDKKVNDFNRTTLGASCS